MLLSSKWENQNLDFQPHLPKIVKVPLPSQQAKKILQNLQVNCSSPNKSVQLEALQCWDAWITSLDLKEWETDSVCHFGVKPLMTKKIHPLCKDSDLCKLKLSIMWKLLTSVQMKMELKGPRYILDIFLQSCFFWLASVEHMEKEISGLIIKLLLALFQSDKKTISCQKYIFLSLQINKKTLEKIFIKFADKFLDVLENWKKICNNSLIIILWKWFLEQCEHLHNFIPTTIWHRIFKVNQAFCSEKNEPLKDKLKFLHICSTKVKTVLSSSKYIGGEGCFTTPCEALFKKLLEISRLETFENVDNLEIFQISKETCETLACKSIEICDYNLCIQLLDFLEDFSLPSFFWGSWCGLIECYEKFLMPLDKSLFTKNQMKFFRKLRAPTVNFELDKVSLCYSCNKIVLNKIKVLEIDCFCQMSQTSKETFTESQTLLPKLHFSNSFKLVNSDIKKANFDVLQEQSQEIISVLYNSDLIDNCFYSKKKIDMTLSLEFGKFSDFDSVCGKNQSLLNYYKPQVNNNLIKDIFSAFQNHQFNLFPNLLVTFRLPAFSFYENKNIEGTINITKRSNIYLCSSDLPISEINEEVSKQKKIEVASESASVIYESTPKHSLKRKSKSLLATPDENLTPRTRSQAKLQQNSVAKPTERFLLQKKNRKSFEMVVQEILQKNKLRKTEKSCGESDRFIKSKRELRSRKTCANVSMKEKQQSFKVTKKEKNIKSREGKKKKQNFRNSSKEEKKIVKTSVDGKLENFFKIINHLGNIEKKSKTPDSNKSKVSKLKRLKKKPNALQQTLNKTTVDELKISGEKDDPKILKKNGKDKNICILLNCGSFEEALKDFKYNEKVQSDQIVTDVEKIKLVTEKFETKETENIDPNTKKTLKKLTKNVEVLKKYDFIENFQNCEQPNSFSCKNEKDFVVQESLISIENLTEGKDNIAKDFGPLGEWTEKFEIKNDDNLLTCDFETSIAHIKKYSNLNNEEFNNTNDIKVEGEACLEESIPKKIFPEEESIFKSKRRLVPSENDDEGSGSKKQKLSDDDDGCVPLKEITSPAKANGKTEMGSPKGKSELSPSQNSKLTNRVVSSRASRMIALIPDSDGIGGPLAKVDSTTQQCHYLNVSPKHESKDRKGKFGGADRNSRVSKMLASLNKQTVKTAEESIEEDKRSCFFVEDIGSATFGSDSVSKAISPKSAKKRKFIGFDESKNQTVIYRINTPPSKVLEEWKLLKEEYLNVQETEPE